MRTRGVASSSKLSLLRAVVTPGLALRIIARDTSWPSEKPRKSCKDCTKLVWKRAKDRQATWCGTEQVPSRHFSPRAGSLQMVLLCVVLPCGPCCKPHGGTLLSVTVWVPSVSFSCLKMFMSLSLSTGHLSKHGICEHLGLWWWFAAKSCSSLPVLSSPYSLKTNVLIGSKRTWSFLTVPFLSCHCDFQVTSGKEFKLWALFHHQMK